VITVHPRVCGERHTPPTHHSIPVGSSPRVRGTQRKRSCESQRARFIPACAGNASGQSGSQAARSVHPRVCGERCAIRIQSQAFSGSSPRVRGTRIPVVYARVIQRFIPACAGNAMPVIDRRDCRTVHPRVCGERRNSRPITRLVNGSSPRVRGTRMAGLAGIGIMRFIPACAGNALDFRGPIMRNPVHPRVCGERKILYCVESVCTGSSPRVRGTLCAARIAFTLDRFIPACAGNANP